MPHLTRATARSRRQPRSRGQSLVEFALVLPIFLLILCAIMDFGFLLYSRMTVINAAREGARVATTMTDAAADIPSTVEGQVSAVAGGLDVVTEADCVPTPPKCPLDNPSCGCAGPGWEGASAGNSVRVTVRYSHSLFFPLLFGTTIPMSSTVQMVLE